MLKIERRYGRTTRIIRHGLANASADAEQARADLVDANICLTEVEVVLRASTAIIGKIEGVASGRSTAGRRLAILELSDCFFEAIQKCIKTTRTQIEFDRDLFLRLVNLPSLGGKRKDLILRELNQIVSMLELCLTCMRRAQNLVESANHRIDNLIITLEHTRQMFDNLVGNI